jgi:hypothetical protein
MEENNYKMTIKIKVTYKKVTGKINEKIEKSQTNRILGIVHGGREEKEKVKERGEENQ